MNNKIILNQLSNCSDFPEKSIIESIRLNRDFFTPYFLSEVNQCLKDKRTSSLFLFSIYFLAEFKEEQAFPLFIQILKLDEALLDKFLGDIITEHFSQMLASAYNGELHVLTTIIEDQKRADGARQAALYAVGILMLSGKISKEHFIHYLENLKLESEDESLNSDVVTVIAECKLHELYSYVKKIYMEKGILRDIMPFHEEVTHLFDEQIDLKIDIDIERDCKVWFEQAKKFNFKEFEAQLKAEANPERNSPCPCKSGKKFKKCCLMKTPVERYKSMALIDYPTSLIFTECFSEEAIELDKLIYCGYTKVFYNIGLSETSVRQIRKDVLKEAYEKFKIICEKYNIRHLKTFDERFAIHFFAEDWLEEIEELCYLTGEIDSDMLDDIENLLEANEEAYSTSDIEQYEQDHTKLIDENNQRIIEFLNTLRTMGLTEKTIKKHHENLDLFLNSYLARDLMRIEEIFSVDSYFSWWYPNKVLFSSVSGLKSSITSIKKFYNYLYEENLISKENYHEVLQDIKENKKTWITLMEEESMFDDEYIYDIL